MKRRYIVFTDGNYGDTTTPGDFFYEDFLRYFVYHFETEHLFSHEEEIPDELSLTRGDYLKAFIRYFFEITAC